MFTEDLKQCSQNAENDQINSERAVNDKRHILRRATKKEKVTGWEELPNDDGLDKVLKARMGEGRPLILHQLRNTRK